MTRYYWDREAMDWVTAPPRRAVAESVAPAVIGDITPYACPITGTMITSRSRHRDNLRLHGMRVAEPDEFKPRLIGPDYAGHKNYDPDYGQQVQRELDARIADSKGYVRSSVTEPGVPA